MYFIIIFYFFVIFFYYLIINFIICHFYLSILQVILKVSSFVNSTCCCYSVQMEKFVDAMHVCDDAFQLARVVGLKGPQIDAKLFFRRAICSLHLHNYDQAVSDLQEAVLIQPRDAAIAQKLKEAKRLADAQRKKEIRVYSRMFGASTP